MRNNMSFKNNFQKCLLALFLEWLFRFAALNERATPKFKYTPSLPQSFAKKDKESFDNKDKESFDKKDKESFDKLKSKEPPKV